MKTNKLVNTELGLNLDYWQGSNKNERVFLAKQIMEQLGYKGGNKVLNYYELEEGVDKVTLKKKKFPKFFQQLGKMNLLGSRAGSVIMLYESGVWKLIMQSKKQIGINTRNWLAREVLPSIKAKGYYDVSESEMNPLSYLNNFTEEKVQKEFSKKTAKKIQQTGGGYSAGYNAIHKLVTGMDAKEIKKFFGSKVSARETLRLNVPHFACTEAVIDELFANHNKTIEDIKKSNAHKTLPPAFESLYKLGIKPMI